MSSYYRTLTGQPDKREVSPTFGARHSIENDLTVQALFWDIDDMWGDELPQISSGDPLDPEYTNPYMLYDSEDKLGMSVFEGRRSRQAAEKALLRWNANTFGQVTVKVNDRLAKLNNELADMALAGELIDVTLSEVIRVGECRGSRASVKVAVAVDLDCPAAKFMADENEILISTLAPHIPTIKQPDLNFVAKLTLGRLPRGLSGAEVSECMDRAQTVFPVTVKAQPMTLFSNC